LLRILKKGHKLKKLAEAETFTQIIQAAAWVPVWAAETANSQRGRFVTRHLKNKREKKGDPLDEIHSHTIEALLTHSVFKSLWEADDKLEQYFFNIFDEYREKPPNITEAQKRKKIAPCISHLKSIINLTKFDDSVLIHFNESLRATIFSQFSTDFNWWDAGFKWRKESTADFLQALCANLNKDLGMGTHYNYPRKLPDAERIYFILSVSDVVQHICHRPKHKLTADILNVIRPDLDVFDANGISKAVNRRNKERSRKKSA